MLTAEETLQVALWMTKYSDCPLSAQQEFEKMFNKTPPSQSAILDLYTKFKESQAIADRNNSISNKNCEFIKLFSYNFTWEIY